MQNPTPKSIGELLDLGTHVGYGVKNYGPGLGLLQYTDANYSPLVSDLNAKQNVHNTKRSAVASAFGLYIGAMEALRTGCLTARKILSVSLGDNYSEAW